MKPTDERYQAATTVNAISPEIDVIEKADSMEELEGRTVMGIMGEFIIAFPGSSGSGMVLNGLCWNLGDPNRFPMGISANKPRR